MTQHTPPSAMNILRELLANKSDEVNQWFAQTFARTPPFFYNSVDIRHSGFKLAPVDTNLFPGGFNNLTETERQKAVIYAKDYFARYYPHAKNILIIAEDHTRNLYYFENIIVLQHILQEAGLDVRISNFLVTSKKESQDYQSASGQALQIDPMIRHQDQLRLDNGFRPDLVIINNDLTGGTPELISNLTQPVIPPPEFGWHQRRKTSHFEVYNELVRNFCNQFSIDPWLISTIFSRCNIVDFKEQTGLECVARNVEKTLYQIREKYAQYGIKDEPYVFVKSDRGTYGMGIMTAKSGDDILHLNKQTRKKMSAIKGGITNTEVMIQEGIPTIDMVENHPAEPMIYVVGGEAVGCIYRLNTKQDQFANLNSSGMSFASISQYQSDKGFCTSLGFIAKLAGYAAAWECYENSYSI